MSDLLKGYDCDVLFLIDATGSMGSTITAVKEKVRSFPGELKEFMRGKGKQIDNLGLGCAFYRDYAADRVHWIAYKEGSPAQMVTTQNYAALERFIGSGRASGGGSWPEGGYNSLVKSITQTKWLSKPMQKQSRRIIILMTDAGSHQLYREDYPHVYPTNEIDDSDALPFMSELWKDFAYKQEGRVILVYEDGRREMMHTYGWGNIWDNPDDFPFTQHFFFSSLRINWNTIFDAIYESFAQGTAKKETLLNY